MTISKTTHSPDETMALGRRFAAVLTAGDIVLLSGPLGAGKTVFVAGVAEGLGIAEAVTSPTFVISRVYRDGFLPLVHTDVYRLSSIGEFDDLEILDVVEDGVAIIEWGHAIADGVGASRLDVDIAVDGDERTFTFSPVGSWIDRSLEMLT
jgi:tRNA threonylcarbamoyladenosine biosynthesis protein TsaE